MLTPSVSVIGVSIGAYLKLTAQNPSWLILGGLGSGLIVAAFLSSYYTHIKPLRDPAANGRLLLDTIGGRIIQYGKSKDIQLRLNVLLVYRPAKFLFFVKRFRVRWSLEMKYTPDGTAEFGIKQGVAGEALATGTTMLVDLEDPDAKRLWKFSAKEIKRFEHLTMVWCYPIYEVDKNGDPTGKKLGTVNLDSTSKGAIKVVLRDSEFGRMMDEFRDIVSKVTSC